jgi:hypothetical protein
MASSPPKATGDPADAASIRAWAATIADTLQSEA